MKEPITVEEAVQIVLTWTRSIAETECVSLDRAGGRILAEDIHAVIDQPPFNRSPIDGYACHSADLAGCDRERPVRLKVICEVDAGTHWPGTVGCGEAIRIMTGAPVPADCDVCVRQEDTDYGETEVAVYQSHEAWDNVCFKGEDYQQGALLIARRTKLTYAGIAVLASNGLTEITVYRMPRVAVFTTGDEVIEPGQPLSPAKIFNSNGYLLTARLRELGIEALTNQIVPDIAGQMAEILMQTAAAADLIITTGGVSVGKKDIMHEALDLAGASRQFWRVRMKPGTPTIFSVLNGVPVLSLSGNPFGAAANFELLVRPMLAKMTFDPLKMYRTEPAVMADAFPKASPGRRFIRAILRDGQVYLPSGLHASGVLSTLQGCNCLIDIPAGNPGLSPGDKVRVIAG